MLYALAEDCRDRGHLDLSERFVDGSFVIAKKGAVASASPDEVTLVEPTLASCFPAALPARLVGDKSL
jgi:hypothetical protein